MMQLKPDIYKMIVESMLATEAPPDFETKLDQQQNLARMMRVSKLLYTICEPFLYKDCLVGDINLFVHDLERLSRKEDLLNRVRTLRLYHPIDHMIDVPSYFDLLCRAETWAGIGLRFCFQDHFYHFDRAWKEPDYAEKLWARNAGGRLRFVTQSDNMDVVREDGKARPEEYLGRCAVEDQPFAKLERVIMTGNGDQSWGDLQCDHSLPFDTFPSKDLYDPSMGLDRDHDIKPIPHFLIGLNSVKYYCQTCTAGPLALANDFLNPINKPNIVTYHIKSRSTAVTHFPPIVAGAINRYIFATTANVRYSYGDGDVETPEAVARILDQIKAMLFRKDEALCIGSETIDYRPFAVGKVPIDDTFIEVYNLYRHICHSKVVKFGVDHGPSNLKGVQDQLDLVIGDWKGRVALKNIEDAPPCPACDLGGHQIWSTAQLDGPVVYEAV